MVSHRCSGWRSRSDEVMLSRARDPVQHWITPGTRRLILYLAPRPVTGAVQSNPPVGFSTLSFRILRTPSTPRSVMVIRSPVFFILLLFSMLCMGGGGGGWSWFIFVNRGRGWAVFYLGFDEFEREERIRRNVTSNDFCERGWGESIGLSW